MRKDKGSQHTNKNNNMQYEYESYATYEHESYDNSHSCQIF